MDNILAKNIRRRRLLLGLDQEQLAGRLGVSRITFSKYENGKSPVNDDVFYRLSRIFNVSPDVLLESPEYSSIPFFRHKSLRSQREKAGNHQMILDAEKKFADYQFLEEVSGEIIGTSSVLALAGRVDSVSDARALGEKVRNLVFGQGFENVRRFGEAFEANGIKFLAFPFPVDGEFGFMLKLEDGSFGIAVNNGTDVPGERQLFTLCHELGHLLMHYGQDNLDSGAAAEKRRESEANAFAGGMLIPDREFREAWDATEGRVWFDRILAVKRIFTVSYQTVIHSLEDRYRADTGKNSVPPYRTWFRENYTRRFGRSLPAHEEACPAGIRIESDRFVRLARKAFLSGEITMQKLAEMLDKPLIAVRELVNEWGREASA